ncbi:MAG TPA: hypothetical protein DCE41_10285 [Cytophagales bacterium]|nr:hypothetical protein [Cytophagales bacterium]HAA17334.1 hypothetical protein [Cytophagales bacterium]HAP60514.1 hypothetical protein [Cytophagales bacterium]
MSSITRPQDLLGWFRLVALIEGVSFLLILFVTMPLKYGLGMHEPNLVIGYAHGFLFITYMVLAGLSILRYKWGFWPSVGVLAASLIPFGTFVADKRVMAPTAEQL